MKALSKDDHKRRNAIANELDVLRGKVKVAISDYNAKVSELWQPLANAIEAYNEAVNSAQGWRDDIVSEMQSYIDERSEKWLESDNGNSYQDWKADWDCLSLEEIDIDEPEQIEMPDIEGADALRNLEPAVN